MTAQLPQGLIRVVSASHTNITSDDPADIIFERKQALYNFWKVHDAQSRAIQDASNIRCRQLFWRVWGNPHLSLNLSQTTMMRLWMQCQQDFDFSPFNLQILDSTAASSYQSASSMTTQIASRRLSAQSEISDSSASISPTHISPTQSTVPQSTSSVTRIKQAPTKPALSRTISGNEPPRKRPSVTSANSRGKARPSMPRKKSSQSTQPPVDNNKPRKSIIKCPQSPSQEVFQGTSRRESKTTIMDQITQSPASPGLMARKVSVFELPSASWQSVDSQPDPFANAPQYTTAQGSSSLLVDKNFRERFIENQKQLRSSTNLVDMNRAMRKTGSVVRFADEVDAVEDLRKLKAVERTSPFAPRAASDSQQPKDTDRPRSWRQPLPHRDSVGSVAAISDDESDDLGLELELGMPRVKSQLSLAIADLKRSQSAGEASNRLSRGITSPQIEQEQEALISGVVSKKKNEEEDKLLAMAHKGGVTKAGGVNMPKEMTVEGLGFELGSSYESPEEPLY